ncbi:unnamed protein product [Rotaria sp. Silwood1]|nr:unnamed protein product [Rotaria sp. Silwood1]
MILYRGQVMSDEELNKLGHGVGNFISTNGFFSTSLVKQVATDFLQHAKGKCNELKQVFFEIIADSTVKSVVFADIEWLSLKKEEHEVLFSIGAIFKIESVTFSNEMRCWLVRMTATDEGMKDVQEYIDFTKKHYGDMDVSIIFGRLLIDMNELTKAEKYFNLLMKTTEKNSLLEADILVQMGHINMTRAQHSAALQCYSRAYDIRKDHFHSNHSKIGDSLKNMASVSYETSDYEKAINYYKDFLNIYGENYGNIDHMSIAKSLQMLGKCYRSKGDLRSALDFSTKALEMKQRLLPSGHWLIADTFKNIGLVYNDLKDYDKALIYYFDALEIFEKTLPPTHRQMPDMFRVIVKAYSGKGDYEAALSFSKKKLDVLNGELDETQPSIGRLLSTTGDIYRESHDNVKALAYYEKALTILEKCSPPEEKQIWYCLQHVGDLHAENESFQLALNSYSKQLAIGRRMYLSDNSRVGITLRNIGMMNFKLKNYEEAMKYLEEARQIFQSKSPDDHEEGNETLKDIHEVKKAQKTS